MSKNIFFRVVGSSKKHKVKKKMFETFFPGLKFIMNILHRLDTFLNVPNLRLLKSKFIVNMLGSI